MAALNRNKELRKLPRDNIGIFEELNYQVTRHGLVVENGIRSAYTGESEADSFQPESSVLDHRSKEISGTNHWEAQFVL